jgi:hypothetical protein
LEEIILKKSCDLKGGKYAANHGLLSVRYTESDTIWVAASSILHIATLPFFFRLQVAAVQFFLFLSVLFVHRKSVKLFLSFIFIVVALPKPLSVNKRKNSSRLTT